MLNWTMSLWLKVPMGWASCKGLRVYAKLSSSSWSDGRERVANISLSLSLSMTHKSTSWQQQYHDCLAKLFLQLPNCQFCSVLFFSCPRSEGWTHHGRTFSICRCPLSFWLTLPRRVLSTSWCCPSRPCMAFLACVHLALFLALSISPGNYLVSSWCDHSLLASLLWQCLTVPSLLQLC